MPTLAHDVTKSGLTLAQHSRTIDGIKSHDPFLLLRYLIIDKREMIKVCGSPLLIFLDIQFDLIDAVYIHLDAHSNCSLV